MDISTLPRRAATLIETPGTESLERHTQTGKDMLAAVLGPDIALNGRDPDNGGHPNAERVLARLKDIRKEAEARRRAYQEAPAAGPKTAERPTSPEAPPTVAAIPQPAPAAGAAKPTPPLCS